MITSYFLIRDEDLWYAYYRILATFAPGVARDFYLIESRIVLFYCVSI